MSDLVVGRFIAELDRIYVRLAGQTPLWFGDGTEHSCRVFLAGFETACRAAGVPISTPISEMAASQRGWSGPLLNQIQQMRERGFSEEQVIIELFAIEIEALKFLQKRGGLAELG